MEVNDAQKKAAFDKDKKLTAYINLENSSSAPAPTHWQSCSSVGDGTNALATDYSGGLDNGRKGESQAEVKRQRKAGGRVEGRSSRRYMGEGKGR